MHWACLEVSSEISFDVTVNLYWERFDSTTAKTRGVTSGSDEDAVGSGKLISSRVPRADHRNIDYLE